MIKNATLLLITFFLLLSCRRLTKKKPSDQSPDIIQTEKRILGLDSCYPVKDLSTFFEKDSFHNGMATPTVIKEKMAAMLREHIKEDGNSPPSLEYLATLKELVVQYIHLDTNLEIFIVHIDFLPLGNQYYVYLVKDRKTISSAPYSFYGGNMNDDESDFNARYRLLSKPLCYITDIDRDKRPELVFKQRAHNGNMYNAVQEIYLNYDDSLHLTEKFQLEIISLAPFDETDNRLLRYISYNPRTGLYTISCFFSPEQKKEVPLAGELILSLNKGKWRLIRKRCVLPDYCKMLLTTSPDEEADLFKKP